MKFRKKKQARPACRHTTIKPINWLRPEGFFGDYETRVAVMCFDTCGQTVYYNMGVIGNPSVETMVRFLEHRGYQMTSDGLMHKQTYQDEFIALDEKERMLIVAGLGSVAPSPRRDALIIKLSPFSKQDLVSEGVTSR